MVSECSSIVFRNAQPQDLQPLTSLLLRSFDHGLGEENNGWIRTLLKLSIQADLRPRLNVPSSRFQRNCCMVAVCPSDQHRIIGTVEVSLQRHTLWLPSTQYLYLSNLAVEKDYRRQGVAVSLLQRCEVMAETWNVSDLYLHVRENNTAARQLYERNGYRIKRVDFNWGTLILQQPRALFLYKTLKR